MLPDLKLKESRCDNSDKCKLESITRALHSITLQSSTLENVHVCEAHEPKEFIRCDRGITNVHARLAAILCKMQCCSGVLLQIIMSFHYPLLQ